MSEREIYIFISNLKEGEIKPKCEIQSDGEREGKEKDANP